MTIEFILLLILFAICLFIVIGWSIVVAQEPDKIDNPPISNAQYGSVCSANIQCAEGLTCERINDVTSVCKTKLNYPCTTIIQCENSALYCANVCSLTDSGGIGQPGPCNEGLILDEFDICRYDTGQACENNVDCASQSCYQNICTLTYANGSACTGEQDCLSKNCSNGFCQEFGVTTGEEGAICSIENTCNETLACSINYQGGFSDLGVCRFEVTFPGSCSSSVACPSPTICWNGECSFPRTEDEYTPDSCILTEDCISTSTCIDGTCIDNNDFGLFRWSNNSWENRLMPPNWEYYIEDTLSILEKPDGPWILYKISLDEYITDVNGNSILAPKWKLWDSSTDRYMDIFVTLTLKRGDYKNNGTVETQTNSSFYLACDNFKFTPGNSILFTYMLYGSPAPNIQDQIIYRAYITDIITDDIFTEGLISFETWISTVRVNSVDYRVIRGIQIDGVNINGITSINVEDRVSSSGQIKLGISDTNNFLGGNVYIIEQINMDRAGAGSINFILFRNNCNYAAPFVWDWLQYFPDEYVFKQIQDKRAYISYDNMYDPLDPTVYSEEIFNVTLPPMDSLPYEDLIRIRMYYPYGNTLNFVVIAYIVQYQNKKMCWAILNGYSVFLPSTTFRDIGVSIPVVDNFNSYVYQVR